MLTLTLNSACPVPPLSAGIADRLLIARLSLDPSGDVMTDDPELFTVLASLPKDQTSWDYLLGAWKRAKVEEGRARKVSRRSLPINPSKEARGIIHPQVPHFKEAYETSERQSSSVEADLDLGLPARADTAPCTASAGTGGTRRNPRPAHELCRAGSSRPLNVPRK